MREDPMQPVRLKETNVKRVHIGRNSWLGANAVVMADVGDDAIVGAGAVVVQPVSSGTTVVGNPAKQM
jgi:acetyltransferase-like isoleucine patch superfamily enzyme